MNPLRRTAAVALSLLVLLGLATPGPSLAADPVCTVGGIDLCTVWQTDGGQVYPIEFPVDMYDSCETWVEKPRRWGLASPHPGTLGTTLLPRLSDGIKTKDGYQYDVSFGAPIGQKVEVFMPLWPNMTNAQKAFLEESFFPLVLEHEIGHQNIIAFLSAKFTLRATFSLKGGPKKAQTAAELWAADTHRDLIAAVERIETATFSDGYDTQTAGSARQSVLGGTDHPSLQDLCDVLPITSTFDVDDEGWTVAGDAVSNVPDHHLLGGNPGGFIEVEDLVASNSWYWVAPDQYLGDKSEAYGTLLTFDLKQSQIDRPYDQVDVRIGGAGEVLTMKFGSPPGLDWTSYSVRFDVSGGWIDEVTQLPATAQQIQAVLDQLDQLQIRGEYRIGEDIGGLDNVSFGVGG